VLGEHRREVLPNGLRVLLVENPSLHSFVCSVYVRAGARFEAPERTGLSHFLEHMLLQGSENYPTFLDIMRSVEDLGGVVDGQTHSEYMKLAFGVHRKHWRSVMKVVADVIMRPLFDKGEVKQEKSIITQEISRHRDRKGRNISVYELAYELLLKEKLDEAGSRGSPQIMAGFDREMVLEHYRRFFVPENMVLCLAGGVGAGEALEEVRGCFAPLRGGDGPPELVAPDVKSMRARSIYRETEARPIVEALLCHRAYPLGHDRFDAFRAVSHLLGGGLTSRLFTRVREELGLVYDVGAYPQGYSDVGSLDVSFSVDVKNLVPAFEAVLDVMGEVAGENFTADELGRYKESARCGMEILCDNAAHVADWFGKQELLLGGDRVLSPEDYIARQEALTLDSLRQALDEALTHSGANLAVAGPFADEQKRRMCELFPAEEAETKAEG